MKLLLSSLLFFSLFQSNAIARDKVKPDAVKKAELGTAKAADKPVVTQGTEVEFVAADGKSEFLAIGRPSFLKIAGIGEGPKGKATVVKDIVNATLIVDVTKFNTNNDLRDDHMKNKYLEVAKFPESTLVLKDLKIPVDFDKLSDKETEVPFTGDFTLHGKTKVVSGKAKISKKGKEVNGTATFQATVTDHLDTIPAYLGIKVADTVDVTIKFKGTVK